MTYSVGAVMCMVWFFVGVLCDRYYCYEAHLLKGPLIGQVTEAYETGMMTVNVYAGDARSPEKCLFIKGEKGHISAYGAKGGDGGTGMICGDSIGIIMPGHGGEGQ